MGTTLTQTAPLAAPTRSEAQRIADVFIAKHGVAEVAMFGSVARGEATPYSDVGLLAIYADMDYTQRGQHTAELRSAARTIVGRNIDIDVKALIALEGKPISKTHSALELLDLLPSFVSSELQDLLTQEEWGSIRDWRQAGTYLDARLKMELLESEVANEIDRYYKAIIHIAPLSIEQYEHRYGTSDVTSRFRKELQSLDRRIPVWDIAAGQKKSSYALLLEPSNRKIRWLRRRKRKKYDPAQLTIPGTQNDNGDAS